MYAEEKTRLLYRGEKDTGNCTRRRRLLWKATIYREKDAVHFLLIVNRNMGIKPKTKPSGKGNHSDVAKMASWSCMIHYNSYIACFILTWWWWNPPLNRFRENNAVPTLILHTLVLISRYLSGGEKVSPVPITHITNEIEGREKSTTLSTPTRACAAITTPWSRKLWIFSTAWPSLFHLY